MFLQNFKVLSPLCDPVFKRLFKDEKSKNVANFLECVIGAKANNVRILDPHYYPKSVESSIGIHDILFKLDGYYLGFEIQNRKTIDYIPRLIKYEVDNIGRLYQKGVELNSIDKAITVAITDFPHKTSSNNYIHHYAFRHEETNELLTDKIAIIIIDLTKLPKENDNTAAWEWFYFFKNADKEDFNMLNIKNENIKEFYKNLAELSQDVDVVTEEQQIQNSRRAYYDSLSADIAYGVEQGIAERIEHDTKISLEKGIKQGLEQGLEQGIEIGIKQVSSEYQEKQIHVIKNIFKLGIDIKNIAETYSMSESEVKEILNL